MPRSQCESTVHFEAGSEEVTIKQSELAVVTYYCNPAKSAIRVARGIVWGGWLTLMKGLACHKNFELPFRLMPYSPLSPSSWHSTMCLLQLPIHRCPHGQKYCCTLCQMSINSISLHPWSIPSLPCAVFLKFGASLIDQTIFNGTQGLPSWKLLAHWDLYNTPPSMD